MSHVLMVRIYLTEDEVDVKQLMHYLHDDAGVRGVTIFRGLSGFGDSGEIHSASWLDLSFDLPLVIEFFDDADKVKKHLPAIKQHCGDAHIVHWPAATF